MVAVSINDLPVNLDQFNYQMIGQGAFHKVYIINHKLSVRDYSGYFVLKIPYAIESSSDHANTAERTERKLKELHPEAAYPVVAVKGYRLIFITEKKKPFQLEPGFVYVYIKKNQLEASFINAQEQQETHSLEDLKWAASLKNKINAPPEGKFPTQVTNLEEENSIFRQIGCPRAAIFMPYFGPILNPLEDDGCLLNYLIDLYRSKRMIVLDTFGGNFAKDNGDRIVCIDTDYAIHRDSPISQQIFYKNLEIQDQFDTAWSKYENQMALTLNVIHLPRLLAYMEKHLSASDIVDEYINRTILSGVQIFYANKLVLLPTDMGALCLLSTRLKAQGFLDVTFDYPVFTPDFIRSFPAATSERQNMLIEQAMMEYHGISVLQEPQRANDQLRQPCVRAVQPTQGAHNCASTQKKLKEDSKNNEAFQLPAEEDISPLVLPPPVQQTKPRFFRPVHPPRNGYSALTQEGGLSLFSSSTDVVKPGAPAVKKLRADSVPFKTKTQNDAFQKNNRQKDASKREPRNTANHSLSNRSQRTKSM